MFRYILLIFSIFILNHGFSQVKQETKVNVSSSSYSYQQRELVTSEPNTKIIEPLEVDLNNYTHLALVDINSLNGRKKKSYNIYEERLMSSPLTIVNPTKDKKKFKKDPLYLREVKNPKWVYLYYTRKQGSGNDDVNTTVILRDSENNVLYSSSHTNVGIPEILYPLIGF